MVSNGSVLFLFFHVFFASQQNRLAPGKKNLNCCCLVSICVRHYGLALSCESFEVPFKRLIVTRRFIGGIGVVCLYRFRVHLQPHPYLFLMLVLSVPFSFPVQTTGKVPNMAETSNIQFHSSIIYHLLI